MREYEKRRLISLYLFLCLLSSFAHNFSISLLIYLSTHAIYLSVCLRKRNIRFISIKVLEAITTKKSQDQFHLESLETLGDSFLKYAVCQHLFQNYLTHHEGLLSAMKVGMISNVMLCKVGCEQKLQGFIRNDCFEPKEWMVPGQSSTAYALVNETLPKSGDIYISKKRHLKRKCVADVVESLIGAYLSEGGQLGALMFMDWVGIKVDLTTAPIQREPPSIRAEKLVNIRYMESLLNYKFKDKTLSRFIY